MQRALLLSASFLVARILAQILPVPVIVSTTSGQLVGVEVDGVASFKGVRFAQPPVGLLRWEPPTPFTSNLLFGATTLPPACVQQFAFANQAFDENLFNNPPPPEDEDCLFLNVWAPAPLTGPLKPVVIWIFGGSFNFGTGSLPIYDGTSFAKNQDIVVVTFNYRTNVFGFPESPDIPVQQNNLGLLDQELVFTWVQQNIAQFGGDKDQVTLMGQSAGSGAVALAILRHGTDAPFRAGIMLSGVPLSSSTALNFSSFNAFALAVGCTEAPGSAARLQCLRAVPAATIRSYTNGPSGGSFGLIVDNVTAFDSALQRIQNNQLAPVPILLGSMQDDGTVFSYGLTDLQAFLDSSLGAASLLLSAPVVRLLYPGLNDSEVIAAVVRDVGFRCPTKLWADTYVQSGLPNVFRYTYGAVFPDTQVFPGAGAWHSSEVRILFGTYNTSSATPAEATLSASLQAAFANFVKDPTVSPAQNWSQYDPGLLGITLAPTLAAIAYNGNVDPGNFVQPEQQSSINGPCAVWDLALN
ncbi:alpha/beta-hydrolase [Artomyces pyxidatus]|uniref:Alpha/beta-hydrolase n=1 Tax=Artomyces pyxidatus TaxID=48021 RepID=A0ACB8TD95_9AGAM|nr:alpha/beta-hydrolase [Artomyces pyxidatus]